MSKARGMNHSVLCDLPIAPHWGHQYKHKIALFVLYNHFFHSLYMTIYLVNKDNYFLHLRTGVVYFMTCILFILEEFNKNLVFYTVTIYKKYIVVQQNTYCLGGISVIIEQPH